MQILSRKIDRFESKTDNELLPVTKMYRHFAAFSGYFRIENSFHGQMFLMPGPIGR
jgi:hypothetical protein